MSRSALPKPSGPESSSEPALLDRVLFYALVALLCARPLICETYESGQVAFLAALPGGAGPTPATTAWLDTVLLATSVLALLRRERWRHKPLVALFILLLTAAVAISAMVAADRSSALLAGASLVVFVLAAVALASQLQARWMGHVVAAALLATGCATAIKCINQVAYENPQTLQEWRTVYRPQLIEQGFDADDPLFVNFERRMLAREASGFLAHPNITGSCLMMCGLVAIGGLAAGLANRQPVGGRRLMLRTAGAAVVILLAVGLLLTRSRGAIVAGVFGTLALVILGLAAAWIGGHARRVLVLLATGYVALIVAGTGYGLSHGTLPHSSLAFRWWYWTAAARAVQDAPLTGIGRNNFAAAYMQYKTPESPEEVRDPHNVWVSLLTELGPLGLVGGTGLCVVSLLSGLRKLRPQRPAPGAKRRELLAFDRVWPAALGVVLVQAAASGRSLGEAAGVIIWSQDILLAWTLPFAGIVWLLSGVGTNARGAVWLTAGACAAMLAALLHGLIDFALVTPGGLAVFVLCLVAALGSRDSAAEEKSAAAPGRAWMRGIAFVVGGALIVAHLAVVVRPTTRAATVLRELDTALHTPAPEGPAQIMRIAGDYTARHGGDATARAAIRAMLQATRSPVLSQSQRLEWLTLIRTRAVATCRVNPHETSNYKLMAMVAEELARLHAAAGDAGKALGYRREAAQSWQQAVASYPTDPRTRIAAGQAWLEIWQATGDVEAATRARANFEMALWVDDRRPPEEVVRLRPHERAPVEEHLRQIPADNAPTSAPGS